MAQRIKFTNDSRTPRGFIEADSPPGQATIVAPGESADLVLNEGEAKGALRMAMKEPRQYRAVDLGPVDVAVVLAEKEDEIELRQDAVIDPLDHDGDGRKGGSRARDAGAEEDEKFIVGAMDLRVLSDEQLKALIEDRTGKPTKATVRLTLLTKARLAMQDPDGAADADDEDEPVG